MISRTYAATAVAAACLASLGFAQNVNELTNGVPLNITVGCAEVDCPVDEENNSLSSCQVQNLTLEGVGISAYTLGGVAFSPTWTLGVSRFDTSDRSGSGTTVQRTFFLGTPDLATSPLDDIAAGCALFIIGNKGERNATLFDGGHANDDRGWVGPSCSQKGTDGSGGLSSECVNEMQRVAVSNLGVDAPNCDELAEIFNSQVIGACNPNGAPNSGPGRTSFHGQSSTVYAAPLTGDDAPEPISGSANASSNCWPTLPQTNQLAEVFAFNISTSGNQYEVNSALQDITPVISVWRSKTGNDVNGLINFDASCISPLLVSARDAANESSGLGVALGPRGWLASMVAVVLGAIYSFV